MCIGVSLHPSSSHSLHCGLLVSLAVCRCFCHQPCPVKNWIHLPRSSLDILISLETRKGSSLVNQNLVWHGPLKRDHSLNQRSFKWSSIAGKITFFSRKYFQYILTMVTSLEMWPVTFDWRDNWINSNYRFYFIQNDDSSFIDEHTL